MKYGHYTFTPCIVNNLAAVEVISDSGCRLGSWYMPARCDSLEGFIQRFFDPFTVLTHTDD